MNTCIQKSKKIYKIVNQRENMKKIKDYFNKKGIVWYHLLGFILAVIVLIVLIMFVGRSKEGMFSSIRNLFDFIR